MRSVSNCTISMGLVSVPIKVYTANSANRISFNRLSPDGNRLKQQYVDTITGKVVDTKTCTDKGYEYAKGKYVKFTADELSKLDAAASSDIDIKHFVPLEEIESLRVEKSYLLGTNGGEKSYSLLSKVMEDKWVAAIGIWKSRGRDHLVAIEPVRENGMRGLAMQQLFYQDEHNSITEVGVSGCDASDAELELAGKLVETMTESEMKWSDYKNEYVERVQNMVEAKISGKDVNLLPQQPNPQIIDLFEALKQSLVDGQQKNLN